MHNALLLPFSRYKNPYQLILIDKLNKDGLHIDHGKHYTFLPMFRNGVKKKYKYVFLDWTHQWYLKKNNIYTFCFSFLLLLDLFLFKYLLRSKIIFSVHNILHHENKKAKWLQYFFIYVFAKSSSKIRLFTNGQKEIFKLIFGYAKLSHKLAVIPEGNIRNFYLNKKRKKRKNFTDLKFRNSFLIFGQDRLDKRYMQFINENYNQFNGQDEKYLILNNSKLYELSKSLVNNPNNVMFTTINDDELDVIFNKINTIVLPYSNSTFNSGMTVLALEYDMRVLCTIGFSYKQDLRVLSKSNFVINGEDLYYCISDDSKYLYENSKWYEL